MPNQEPASAWIFGNSSVRVGTQGLFRPYLKTFVPPFLPTRLTAPGSPRMRSSKDRASSRTWPASRQIYWNKRRHLQKNRVQLSQDWFGTPTWPPFYCFGTLIWPPWRQVKTLHRPFDHSSKHLLDKNVQNVTFDHQCKRFTFNVTAIKEPFCQQISVEVTETSYISYQERPKNSSLEPTDKFVGHSLSITSFLHKLLAIFATNLVKRKYTT